jgi:hypothetical protein
VVDAWGGAVPRERGGCTSARRWGGHAWCQPPCRRPQTASCLRESAVPPLPGAPPQRTELVLEALLGLHVGARHDARVVEEHVDRAARVEQLLGGVPAARGWLARARQAARPRRRGAASRRPPGGPPRPLPVRGCAAGTPKDSPPHPLGLTARCPGPPGRGAACPPPQRVPPPCVREPRARGRGGLHEVRPGAGAKALTHPASAPPPGPSAPRPPTHVMRAAAAAALPSSRHASVTSYPLRASSRPASYPMPVLPPVMTTRLPADADTATATARLRGEGSRTGRGGVGAPPLQQRGGARGARRAGARRRRRAAPATARAVAPGFRARPAPLGGRAARGGRAAGAQRVHFCFDRRGVWNAKCGRRNCNWRGAGAAPAGGRRWCRCGAARHGAWPQRVQRGRRAASAPHSGRQRRAPPLLRRACVGAHRGRGARPPAARAAC